jgi:hypothetical protein
LPAERVPDHDGKPFQNSLLHHSFEFHPLHARLFPGCHCWIAELFNETRPYFFECWVALNHFPPHLFVYVLSNFPLFHQHHQSVPQHSAPRVFFQVLFLEFLVERGRHSVERGRHSVKRGRH